MRKPLIGITVESTFNEEDPRTRGTMSLNWNYAEAIASAGGIPIVVPPVADMEEIAALIDGWLIPGGDDISAENFGEDNHPAVELQDPSRFDAEKRLYHAVDPRMPILGICYGCQFLNVIRGGGLHQHLPDVLGHGDHSGGTLQVYKIESGSLLGKVVEASDVVGKSYHHQAVSRLGKGLNIVAVADDGTVEAVEAEDGKWILGVQWHPERTIDDAASVNLFAKFVQEAAQFAALKRDSQA